MAGVFWGGTLGNRKLIWRLQEGCDTSTSQGNRRAVEMVGSSYTFPSHRGHRKLFRKVKVVVVVCVWALSMTVRASGG